MPFNPFNFEGEIIDIDEGAVLNGGVVIPGANSRSSGGSSLESILPLPGGDVVVFSKDEDGFIRPGASSDLKN